MTKMIKPEIETALAEEIGQIAPEIRLETVDRGADLREEFDLDSIDFLALVTALGKRFSLEMPEADYRQMQSYDDMVRYLRSHAP